MILRVRVQPRAKKNALAGRFDFAHRPERQSNGRLEQEWKLLLTAPPVEGRANQACIEFFARGLGIPQSRVRLISGAKSRHKVLELDGVSEEEFLRFAASGRT
ncbi:MAG: hypothetical protein A3H28_12920 [Acidobacteria bacterium RIFCSPLOWO2_02_FULL_61_28]|nr:MAG: hypothetical protein A3H28_12920 [Acidobacteria bacterium RIFCSPLOWO2_02_FULL_61_28]